MEFTSSFSQTNFMGYCPPSQYNSSQYSNYGWEYHQEDTNSEHSNPWRFASEPQDEQENYEGYQPPPQNDSYHYPHGGWEYHQETANSEQSNHMKNYPPSLPSFSFENSSSINYASTQNPSHDSQPTQTSTSQGLSRIESMLKRCWEEEKKFRKRKENFFTNMEVHVAHLLSATKKVERQDEEASVSSKVLMKNEVEEAFDPELLHSQEPLEVTMKHKDSLPEALMENHEEGREEDTQEKSNSSEAENHMKEGVIEPSLQGTLDEDKTPTITQPPRLGLKEVKAIDKNTKKRIVTKISRTTFKKRSTANNPPPDQASKLNQANFKRKLAERKPRKGTIAGTSPPLKSFLLTNWKKMKKVKNNMSS
ncbi:uncharacterized protein DS421_5g144070 [Arachis hypogaea]|nr:uncharacterized protein DS421_5g144070 [Arachis hypogaea]